MTKLFFKNSKKLLRPLITVQWNPDFSKVRKVREGIITVFDRGEGGTTFGWSYCEVRKIEDFE